jgi:hypothetical protein
LLNKSLKYQAVIKFNDFLTIILGDLTRFGKGINGRSREWQSSQQQTRIEATEMRKVKNNIHTSNPAVMFAQGLESLISDPLYSPSKFDEHELSEIRRTANRQDSPGNLFNVLLRQFASR